jgi:hypothetical protein
MTSVCMRCNRVATKRLATRRAYRAHVYTYRLSVPVNKTRGNTTLGAISQCSKDHLQNQASAGHTPSSPTKPSASHPQSSYTLRHSTSPSIVALRKSGTSWTSLQPNNCGALPELKPHRKSKRVQHAPALIRIRVGFAEGLKWVRAIL